MQLQHTRGNAEADEDAKSNYIIEYIILYIYRTEEHYLKGSESERQVLGNISINFIVQMN